MDTGDEPIKAKKAYLSQFWERYASDGNRTHDLQFTKLVLYH